MHKINLEGQSFKGKAVLHRWCVNGPSAAA